MRHRREARRLFSRKENIISYGRRWRDLFSFTLHNSSFILAAQRPAVVFIDSLDAQTATSVMSKDRHDREEQKPRAKQKQTESGATNLSDFDAAFARLKRKCEV